jgi:hypothetical protein
MTLRTIETQWQIDLNLSFDELVLNESKKQFKEHHLTATAPIFDIIHPALLKALKELHQGSKPAVARPGTSDLHFSYFEDSQQAREFIDAPVFRGLPWAVGEVIQHPKLPVILNFDPIGAVVLTSKTLERPESDAPSQYLLPIWLNYAMSPELWAVQGKWMRFHQRLIKIFEDKNLISGSSLPGFYPLRVHAQKLENFGFFGSLDKETYSLYLPWSFSLSALDKLEKIILQEF